MFKKTQMIRKYLLVLGVIFLAAAPGFAQKARTLAVEKQLAELGYMLTKADGVADASTRHAVTAFQKVEGLKRTGVINAALVKALESASRPLPKYTGVGAHIEVDLTRQVLFMVDDGDKVTHILPVSSGNDEKYLDRGKWEVAHTPRGAFDIYRKINGVRKAPLGNLYYPSYFTGGVAIHGSPSIPIKPASHGCVRIPRFADQAIYKMAPIGMTVYVFD